MKKEKETIYYLRAVHTKEAYMKYGIAFEVPEGIDREKVMAIVGELEGKLYITHAKMRFLCHRLTELGLSMTQGEFVISRIMGYREFKGMKKSKTSPERLKDQLQSRLRHLRDHEEAQKNRRVKNQTKGTIKARYGSNLRDYFFLQHTEYVEYIEKLMQGYTNVYLDDAARDRPYGKMGWEGYHKAYGLFWQHLYRKVRDGEFDVTRPGLVRIKQLSHYLFAWGFRRYFQSEVIFRFARFLPDTYRASHIALRRDSDPTDEIDLNYPTLDIEDDEAEEGDDIGNRI